MLKFRKLILLFVLSGCSGFVFAQPLLIQNVTIIDGTGSNIQPIRSVLVEDGHIVKISEVGKFEIPNNTIIIDATDQFLIPGLWDMHTHWKDEPYLPLFIVNGITGVRDMGGVDKQYQWREQERTENYIGPKIILGTPLVDGSPPSWPNSIIVNNEEEAREVVNEYFDKGADFIKVYENLSREAYFAIADESKKLGITFAGHVPGRVSNAEASDAGQKSIEHLDDFGIATSDVYTKIVAGYADKEMNDDTYLEFQERLFAGHRGEKQTELFDKFVSNGTWLSPTLTVLHYTTYISELFESYDNEEGLLYIPEEYAQSRSDYAENIKEIRTEVGQKIASRQFEFYLRLVGDMHKAGIRIIAGTDGSNFCFPGCTVHDELELFVEAGLSPMAALQTATVNAAEFAGRLGEFGTVEEGKIADLVLLEANPLIDIRNTTRISAVVLNGVLHDKSALDVMLTNVRILPANYRPQQAVGL
jgi:imidazolonepropionase-like amidohydrolase